MAGRFSGADYDGGCGYIDGAAGWYHHQKRGDWVMSKRKTNKLGLTLCSVWIVLMSQTGGEINIPFYLTIAKLVLKDASTAFIVTSIVAPKPEWSNRQKNSFKNRCRIVVDPDSAIFQAQSDGPNACSGGSVVAGSECATPAKRSASAGHLLLVGLSKDNSETVSAIVTLIKDSLAKT
ncbi:uncharacterized protein MCYG_04610 [Microsporum canis CBS 113480]|uniref:Uncharacterized protein n=1 Tax=Arthroderma otae (strain ATCC MYA-4605 / CBS 113480) TaxID=554155 RepID=C5FNT8_ARTOC|nr:uncharacterized protein MCYG_04610 [Microsporum canis CBS 113480]EEQ31791.1 predicted protein [Microsporum canis CBS 113480]